MKASGNLRLLSAGIDRLNLHRAVDPTGSFDFWGGGAAANLMTQANVAMFALEEFA